MPRRVDAAQSLEAAGVGVKQHFVALAGVGHQPEGSAGAQFEVGHLHVVIDAAHQQAFFAPVELERLAQLEAHGNEGLGGVGAGLLTPGADEVGDPAVAAAVALGLDLGEQGPAAAPGMFGTVGVGFEGLLQGGLKRGEFAGAAFSPVSGHHIAGRLEPFLDRVARQSRALCDFAVGELVAQLHAPDLAYHFHGDHLKLSC